MDMTTFGFGILKPKSSAPYNPSSLFTGGTAGPWYDFGNTVTTLNGSGTSATGGQTVGTENDAGTAGINASQATDANRPVLQAAHVNSRNDVLEDNTDYFDVTGLDAFTNGASSFTALTVVRPIDATENHRLFRQFDAAFSINRIILDFAGLSPRIAYSAALVDFGNSRTGSALAADTYHAVIYQVDAANGQTGIFANNGVNLAVAAAGGVTVPANFAATNGNQSRICVLSKAYYADIYIHKNALMTAQQRSDWFAAVKARFNLSTY